MTYPGVDNLVRIIIEKGRGCLMWKRDLKRAYRQIPIDPSDYIFLAHSWRCGIYFDLSIPFGLRTGSLATQRTTNAFVYMLRNRGIDCVGYIDDNAGANLPSMAESDFLVAGQLLQRLGLQESQKKSVFPTSNMVFLGVNFDTENLILSVTEDRMREIRSELDNWIRLVPATKKMLQSLLGKLHFIRKCVRSSRVFVSRLLHKLRSLDDNGIFLIDREVRKDLLWWQCFLPHINGITMLPFIPWSQADEVIATDACLVGGTGTGLGQYFYFAFPSKILETCTKNISGLELFVIIIAVKFSQTNSTVTAGFH